MDSSDIWWLVLGSVTGVITHALLNCIGSIISKTKLLRLGVVLWLAFAFFLRTTEFLSLTKQDISFDEIAKGAVQEV